MSKTKKKHLLPNDYSRTFRRLEKQFEKLANSDTPTIHEIHATTTPAGRTLYSAIKAGFMEHLSPPYYLTSDTLLPSLVDKKLKPKYGNWTPEEYSDYWIFAMQWLPTADMTSVPNNYGLQWRRWKWSKEEQKVKPITFANQADYIKHLQALATMYSEASGTIALVLENETAYESTETEQGTSKGRGRPPEYTHDELERMQKAYHQFYEEHKDSKAAWNKVSDLYGKKSGNAVRVACMKLKKST